MAKPNYAFEKRQKELAKKRKKEEKRLKKAAEHPQSQQAAEFATLPAADIRPDSGGRID